MVAAIKRAGSACAFLLVAGSALAELELKPHVSTYELEGIKFPQLTFTDGKTEVTYSPPAGWDSSGKSNKLTLHPKNKAQAEAAITRAPLPEPAPFDEETQKKLADEVLASAPEGSTEVKLVSQEMSPVVIGGKETFLVTISYAFYGENYGRSIMFMNREKEQFRFQFTSQLTDFPDLQRAFFGSHFTWQNL